MLVKQIFKTLKTIISGKTFFSQWYEALFHEDAAEIEDNCDMCVECPKGNYLIPDVNKHLQKMGN